MEARGREGQYLSVCKEAGGQGCRGSGGHQPVSFQTQSSWQNVGLAADCPPHVNLRGTDEQGQPGKVCQHPHGFHMALGPRAFAVLSVVSHPSCSGMCTSSLI
jgi:hypothetical protein